MPRKLCGHLALALIHIDNVTPHSTGPTTPYEELKRHKPNVSHLRRLGSLCYVNVPAKLRHKLQNRATRSFLVGYGQDQGVKGWKCWDPITDKVILSRDVIFHENEGLNAKERDDPHDEDLLEEVASEDEDEYPVEAILDERTTKNKGRELLVKWVGYKTPKWYPWRNFEETEAYDLWENRLKVHNVKVHSASNGGDSLNWHQAMRSDHAPEFKLAADKEIASLRENDTWKLVRRPRNKPVVGSTWVFRTKVNPDGTFAKFKARACAQGFSQQYGIDYTETYSPTIPLAILRLVLAICATKGIQCHSMDAITAFLNSLVDREIFVEQFKGYEDPEFPFSDWVLLLNRALYGLKQSPLLWFKAVGVSMKKMGFVSLDNCPCLFIKHKDGVTDLSGAALESVDWDSVIIVLVYVDDFLICTRNDELMCAVKAELATHYKMTDNGPVTQHLGLIIKLHGPDAAGVSKCTISNPNYIKALLEKYDMAACHPCATPVAPGTYPRDSADEERFSDPRLYQEVVGALMWLSITYRYDISVAVGFASRFSSNPSNHHWKAVKRILRYLKGSIDFELVYSSEEVDPVLRFLCDSDYAGDETDRKSTSGILATYNGAPVHWRSAKQTCVAQSSVEAEYIAALSLPRRLCGCAPSSNGFSTRNYPPHPSISTISPPLHSSERWQSTNVLSTLMFGTMPFVLWLLMVMSSSLTSIQLIILRICSLRQLPMRSLSVWSIDCAFLLDPPLLEQTPAYPRLRPIIAQ